MISRALLIWIALLLPIEKAGASGDWVTLENCRLIPNPANDGDSFHVVVDGKEYLFRLYFVKIPAPHKDLNDWTRAGATSDELFAAINNAETLREQEKSWSDALAISVVTSRELASLALTPRKKLLGEWFAEADSGFIYAPRGAGKTWFALAIAQALSTAGKIGDWQAHEPVKVLYIDTEMPPDLMKDRIKGMGTNEHLSILSHDILFERCGKVLNVATPEIQAAITKRCIDAGVKVLFIDNLSTGARGMRENESDDWEKLSPWLLDLRRRKIAVIIIHHAGRLEMV